MLTADEITALQDTALEITQPIVRFLLGDIANRIATAGKMTSTAQYEAWKLQELGMSQVRIQTEIKKWLGMTHQQLENLLKQSAEVGYRYDLRALPHAKAVPFAQNQWLQNVVSATVRLTQEKLGNITQTMGMVDPFGNALPLQDVYRNCTDFAFVQVSTGAADYHTAIRMACKNLSEKGIRYIDYESGVSTSLEVAVRRNVMSGLGLMQEQISQHNHDAFGCDGWELSAHAASAPDHEPIQGLQFTDAQYRQLNDSLQRRIGTLNCGHTAFPIICGVSIPAYSKEDLQKFREDNERGITYQGKHYTKYEAHQKQRSMEASIRKQRRKILVDEGTDDKEKLLPDQIKLQLKEQEYRRFSKAAGLRVQHDRMETVGYNWKQEIQATTAAKRYNSETVDQKPKTAPVKDVLVQAKTQAVTANAPIAETPRYTDVTQEWRETATPNSHIVEDAQEVTVKGVTYKVDGHNVVLDYSPHEKEIAELLEKEFGGEIKMLPRVNNPQGVSTPDYLFRGEGYDLKTIGETKGKNPLLNRIKKAKAQSKNFVFDVSSSNLSENEIARQIAKTFKDKEASFVDKILIVQNDKVVYVFKRA